MIFILDADVGARFGGDFFLSSPSSLDRSFLDFLFGDGDFFSLSLLPLGVPGLDAFVLLILLLFVAVMGRLSGSRGGGCSTGSGNGSK